MSGRPDYRLGQRVRDVKTRRLGIIVRRDMQAGADLRVFVLWEEPIVSRSGSKMRVTRRHNLATLEVLNP